MFYDLFDSINDGMDMIFGGLVLLYNVFIDLNYINVVNFMMIFEFVNWVCIEVVINVIIFDVMLVVEDINMIDLCGVGEINDGVLL